MLRVRSIDASYGSLQALTALSLVVPDRSVVALLGSNGAGKSTLLRCIAGTHPVVVGAITLDGERIDGLPAARIARRGVVHLPERRGVFPSLTVRENLTLALHAAGTSDPTPVFDAFPVLKERLKQQAGILSGGEQQMLALARALCSTPKLLLADEISLGLAPMIAERIYATLHHIRNKGASILLVDQHPRRALAVADIVVVLHKGRVRFIGEPNELGDDARAAQMLGLGIVR